MDRTIFLILSLISICAFSYTASAGQTLTARRVESAPVIDGIDTDAAWAKAQKITTHDKTTGIEITLKAVHTGRKITYSHLRKFFEQMCNNVLVVHVEGRIVPAMHLGLRDYIMAHNTGSLDVQSYDGKLPVEIYEAIHGSLEGC